MKIRIINLDSREDRKKKFEEANEKFLEGKDWSYFSAIDGSKLTYRKLTSIGFDTDKYWRDPLLKRTLTWGEVGCFMSHWRLWEECSEMKEPMLILEDDAILKEKFDESWLTGDLTYLTHNEMMPAGVEGDRVCYPYWTVAYIITPEAAEKFLDTDVDENIIPVDEFMPRMTDRVVMTSVDKAEQRKRVESGTDVEPKNHTDFVKDFGVHNWTCHNNDEKAKKLLETNPNVKNILDEEWKGGTMEGPGGGQKLNCIRRALRGLPDNDVVVFTDGFDVFWMRELDEVVGRFLEINAEIVFAAEKYLWPDKTLRFPPTPTQYRYLNSGCFIGRVSELRRILELPIEDSDDDQLYLHRRFLSGQFNIKLDYEGYIFMTNSDAVKIKNAALFNLDTKCFGAIYHGNGGAEAKQRFEALYNAMFPEKKYAQLEVSDYKVIGPEMLLVDFMTPSQCEEWIRLGNEHGGWKPNDADKFPSQDIHLNLLGLWDEMDVWWSRVLSPVFEKYWRPTRHYSLRKAFLMKYSMDSQRTLGFHTDAAMITGSVKLNDDYEGATLVFPRQEVTNRDIPVGKMIVFPSSVTHGHYVDELQSGTKYSATFWTSRFKNDLLTE